MVQPSISATIFEQFQDAIDAGNIEALKEMLAEAGPKFFVNYVAWDEPRKESPIHRSINQNKPEVCHLLLSQKKSNVSFLLKHQDFRGESALHRCGWCGREEVAQKLIKLGAKVNATNLIGLTPLHLAAERGRLELVRILLASKADINAKSNQGNTPLHRAVSGGHDDVAAYLISAGASTEAVNKKGARAGGKPTNPVHTGSANLSSQRENNVQSPLRAPLRTADMTSGGKEPSPRNYDVYAARAEGIDIDYYEILPEKVIYGKKLGEGGFGTVYEGSVAGQPVALKTLSAANARVHENFRKELDVMCKLRHPNIVLLLGAIIQTDQLCLVMEICQGGSLTSLLKYRPLDVKEVVGIGRHIAMAMNWLHTRSPPILHLDLKPANILLTDLHSLHIKVSDFGLARAANSDSRAIVGTRRFMAPEMMKKQEVNEKADVYSFGILLWQIYARKKPFSSYKTLKTAQEKNDFAEAVWGGYRPPISMNMPPFLAYMMTQCWATEPEDRPDFQQVIQWLDQVLLHDLFQERSAQIFWDLATVACAERSSIPWSSFTSTLVSQLEEEGVEDVEEDYLDHLQILLCGPSGRSTVEAVSFSALANRFGSFSPAERFVLQTNSLCDAKYRTYGVEEDHPLYYPFMKRDSAVALLIGRPQGTYLLRNPDATEEQSPFVLSFVEKSICHLPVHYDVNHHIYRVGDAFSEPNALIADFIQSPALLEEFGLRYATHKEDYETF